MPKDEQYHEEFNTVLADTQIRYLKNAAKEFEDENGEHLSKLAADKFLSHMINKWEGQKYKSIHS
jgi:hypothetical protein